jgi:hypothetical protein
MILRILIDVFIDKGDTTPACQHLVQENKRGGRFIFPPPLFLPWKEIVI